MKHGSSKTTTTPRQTKLDKARSAADKDQDTRKHGGKRMTTHTIIEIDQNTTRQGGEQTKIGVQQSTAANRQSHYNRSNSIKRVPQQTKTRIQQSTEANGRLSGLQQTKTGTQQSTEVNRQPHNIRLNSMKYKDQDIMKYGDQVRRIFTMQDKQTKLIIKQRPERNDKTPQRKTDRPQQNALRSFF